MCFFDLHSTHFKMNAGKFYFNVTEPSTKNLCKARSPCSDVWLT